MLFRPNNYISVSLTFPRVSFYPSLASALLYPHTMSLVTSVFFFLTIYLGDVSPCHFYKITAAHLCHSLPTFASCLLGEDAVIQLKHPALLSAGKGHPVQ